MTKQYRVITTKETISSYVIEVPDDTNIEEMMDDGYHDWEKHILLVNYEDDVTEFGIHEVMEVRNPVRVEDGYNYSRDDGKTVWTNGW